MFFAMKDGDVEGLLLYGQNPAVGGQNAALQRGAMERLKWLVVRDMFETESAAFWKREGADPHAIGTEVFFLPVAGVAEKRGTFTNTMRLVQFHEKAVEPPGDARSDLTFTYELGKRLKALYAGSTNPLDRPILDVTWDYESDDARERERGEPDVEKIMREINGYHAETGAHLRDSHELRDDGTHGVRRVDLHRHVPGARAQPDAAPHRGPKRIPRRLSGRGPGPTTCARCTTARPPTRRGNRGATRKKLIWWDEAGAPLDRRRRAELPRGNGAVVPRAGRRARRSGRRRRRAVRDARVRTLRDLRRERNRGWADADALRAARVARRQRAVSERAVQSGAQGMAQARQSVSRDRRPEISVRRHDVPADRAPRVGRDEPATAVAGGAAARGVLRDLTGARGGEEHPQRRLGDRGDRARRHRGARARHRPR